jgi:hypothetical protein
MMMPFYAIMAIIAVIIFISFLSTIKFSNKTENIIMNVVMPILIVSVFIGFGIWALIFGLTHKNED